MTDLHVSLVNEFNVSMTVTMSCPFVFFFVFFWYSRVGWASTAQLEVAHVSKSGPNDGWLADQYKTDLAELIK